MPAKGRSIVAGVHTTNKAGEKDGGATGAGSMGDGGGIQMCGLQGDKSRDGYRKLVEYGDGTPLDAGIQWTKRRAYVVLWGVRGRRSNAAEVVAAVQRVLDNAQDGQEWPEEMPERARRQVIPGDGKCLYCLGGSSCMVKMRPKMPLRGTVKKKFFWGDSKTQEPKKNPVKSNKLVHFHFFQDNRLPGKMIYSSKNEVLLWENHDFLFPLPLMLSNRNTHELSIFSKISF